jgi:hypothetical protein
MFIFAIKENIKFLFVFISSLIVIGMIIMNPPVKSDLVGTWVNVGKNVSISISENLSYGIFFENLIHDTNNNNATGNFNSTGHTQYWVTIDSTTNTPIDICIKDNANLTSNSYNIPNSNFRWNSSIINNAVLPFFDGGSTTHALNTSYDTLNKIASNTYNGTYYIRFTLSVPLAQQAGNYNNTVYFMGIDTEVGC